MKRIERKLFKLGDEIESLAKAEQLAGEELIYHLHLNDDTQRDASVSGNPIDRADARETAGDVARFERHIAQLQKRRAKLIAKRERLVAKLAD
ncbi:MAG: hypothetical protein GY926_07835 [bacterium]|nr:hypothetical protein [bacterium]MCP4965131.1 hypothetical protein [bacterium]